MAIIGISGKIGSGKDTTGKIIQYLTTVKEYQKSRTFERFLHDCNGNRFAEQTHTWKIKKFAGKLKQIVSILTGIPVGDLEKQEVKDRVLGEEWRRFFFREKISGVRIPKSFYGIYTKEEDARNIGNLQHLDLATEVLTVRQLLQEVGTDTMRNVIHPNIWVNALFADYKPICKGRCRKQSLGNLEQCTCEDDCIGENSNWIITDLRFPNELKAVEDRNGITIRINRSEKGILFHSINSFNNSQHPSETSLDNANFKYTIENNGTIEELIKKVKEVLIKEKII